MQSLDYLPQPIAKFCPKIYKPKQLYYFTKINHRNGDKIPGNGF